MNKYLKSASENFEKLKQKDYLISPISSTDGEIMTEIIELFKKCNQTGVVEILKQYKFLKDEEIRDQLLECNTNFKKQEIEDLDDDLEEGEEDSPKSMKKLLKTIEKLKEMLARKTEFVIVNEERIMANVIFGYRTDGGYDLLDNFEGKLILNPCDKNATKVPLYANHTFIFYSEEMLNETIELLDKQLEKANIKFVNKEIKEKEDDGGISSDESDID